MNDTRDYLNEAQRIAEGSTLLLPERAHIEALVSRNAALTNALEALLNYPGIKEYVGSLTWQPAIAALAAEARAER